MLDKHIFNFVKFALFIGLIVSENTNSEPKVLNIGNRVPTEADFIKAFGGTDSRKNEDSSVLGDKGITPVEKISPVISSPICEIGKGLGTEAINFEFNSHEINVTSKEALKNFANVAKLEQFKRCTFVIEGHTDAKGSEEYNLWLSEKRANSAVDILTNQLLFDRKRLQAQGKGKTELLDTRNPFSGVNRRVQIVISGSL